MRNHTSLTLKILILLTAIVPLTMQAITVDEVPNVHLSSRTQYVSNPSGILSAAAVNQLNSIIADTWRNTSVELAVVVVDKVDSGSPDDFATELFEKWGIGKSDNDNGVLFFVSRDDRRAVIRTGYGVEGALPDIVAGRIIRNKVLPLFREGDYDSGVIEGTRAVASVLSDPSVRDELMSERPSDAVRVTDSESADEIFDFYLKLSALAGLVMLVYVIYSIRTTRKMDDPERWHRLNRLTLPVAITACLTLGMGVPALIMLCYKMRRVRRHKRNCPHCGTVMQLIDEVHDNDYLTPSQDLEEQLNSVDYDVWHCPSCLQTDIYPYKNRSSRYSECPRCHTIAMSLSERQILRQPTTRIEGEGVDIYYCRNCGNHTEKRFRIARRDDDMSGLAAGAILGSMLGGRGGGFGGGGFSGGSFGGGHTGGGGAGGSW